MKKTLLASVAVLALMAAAPAWAAHHDNQGNNAADTTHHGRGGSGGASSGSGGSGHGGGNPGHGSGGTSGSGAGSGGIMMGSGSTGGHHGRSGGSGGTGSGSGASGSGYGGSMMGSGSTGGRHGRGNSGTGSGSGVNIFGGTMGGTMSGSGHRDRGGRGDRRNNTSIIFGIGGHGYHNGSANFGHSRHNSAFDQFRRAFNAPRHYRYGSYRRPHGWYYRRWNYGDFLPALFFGQDYWISDYQDFDLPYPPEGTVWVRYGNDALLVDEDTGEIIQVIYGIFY